MTTKKKEKEKERLERRDATAAAAAAATAPSSPSPTTTGDTVPLRSTGAIDSAAIPREVVGAELVTSIQTSTLPREVESAELERTITTPEPMVLTADDNELPATLPMIPVVDHGAASTAVLASPTSSTVVVDTTVADMQLILDDHNVRISDAELLADSSTYGRKSADQHDALLGQKVFQKKLLKQEVKSPKLRASRGVDSGGVDSGGVDTEGAGGTKRVYTTLDDQFVQQNAPFGVYVQQQIKELAGMFAVVLEQEEADGTKRVHATLPADSKEGIDLPLCISLSM